MKSIVLAEKPSVAREFAAVLNCSKKKDGYFEGEKYIVTWALGHLVTLAEPHDYDMKYKSWNMEHLPMLPEKMKLKVIRQTSRQFKTVISIMKRDDVEEFIIATDAGREGELVARWIMKLGGWRDRPFKRLWISSQTTEAIKKGFAALHQGRAYNRLFTAAVCRAEADWLIGLNITRALTCKHDAQLSAGRVQTPTLAMIINREREIKNFVPKDYWLIDLKFDGYSGRWRDKNGNSRIFDKTLADEVAAKVQNQKGIVVRLNKEVKKDPPPLAYDLAELQRDANRLFGYSAKKTLSVLQDLYERHKLVTYPRTDSRYITSDMVPTIPARLKAMAAGDFAELAETVLSRKPEPGRRFVNNREVTDHHAIIPTEESLKPEKLETDEMKIYSLIARRFLAVLSPPREYEQINIATLVNGESFFSKGVKEVDPGWTAFTRVRKEEIPNPDILPVQDISEVRKGEQKNVKECKITKALTDPPIRYTEGTLLSAMESAGKLVKDPELKESMKKIGLGTPATRAEIIEKLISTSYIERQGKSLVPTSKGQQIIELVPEDLRSPELTAKWEKRLSDISEGKEKYITFMKDIRENAVALVSQIKEAESTYKADNITNTRCPLCNEFLLKENGKKGYVLKCKNRECSFMQDEKEFNNPPGMNDRPGRKGRSNRKKPAKFMDKQKVQTTTLGDLFEAALKK